MDISHHKNPFISPILTLNHSWAIPSFLSSFLPLFLLCWLLPASIQWRPTVQGVIDNPLVGTTLVAAVNVLATWAAQLLMDSSGRKSLLLWSAGGCFAALAALTLAL